MPRKVEDLHTRRFLAYEAVLVIAVAIVKIAVYVRYAETTRVGIVRAAPLPSAKRRRTTVEPVLSRWIVIRARLRVLVQTNPTACRISAHRNERSLSPVVYNYYLSCFDSATHEIRWLQFLLYTPKTIKYY